MGCQIGNPAPLGLLAFAMTTMMLMYVEMGWVETEFVELVIGYAYFYGGLIQLLVGIFELFKGSTFPFVVFGSYGAFWLGWAFAHHMPYFLDTDFAGTGAYTAGKTAWLIQWGMLTLCFWVVALRKNVCLIVTLGLLWLTFFLLAAGTWKGDSGIIKAAGAVGFCTALAAWYTAVAEVVNEEWGRHVLPGLRPIIAHERFEITAEGIVNRTSYDATTNTIFLQFRGMQIKTENDILAIKEGVEQAFKSTGQEKAHVVVDYEDVLIADDVFELYWETVAELERQYYLSAKRFHVSSFGTRPGKSVTTETSMRNVSGKGAAAMEQPASLRSIPKDASFE